jgi:SAM-dependent methyltransferase
VTFGAVLRPVGSVDTPIFARSEITNERCNAMNEELKPSALSPSLALGINERERAGYLSAGELNDFLLRRQLLAMERKKIQAALDEVEGEKKSRQDHLINYRAHVLASLLEHRAIREQALREERALRQSLGRMPNLRELGKSAERYVRRTGKRLVGHSKAAVPENPAAARALDPGWHLPKTVQLNGWLDWFSESDSALDKATHFRKDRIQVAFVVSGGLGDLLKSTHLFGPICDHFFCDLMIIAAQWTVGEVVAHNPHVRDTLVPRSRHALHLTDILREISVFDLIIVWTYNIQYLIPPGSRISREKVQLLESKAADIRKKLENYSFMHGWPSFNFAFSRETIKLGLSVMKVSVATSGLPHRSPDEIPFFPSRRALRVVARLLTRRYVTVHHGFDLNYLPAKTRDTDYAATKNLSVDQWREIVSLLLKEGVEVIQLGVVEEEEIAGVTRYLNGQTSLEETALLIKHSLCHVDTEGGLVHLATAVHGRCVVAFGPTPVKFFGYPQNINLEPSGCKACWFATKTWLIECPRHTRGPECMKGHSAASVAEAAKRIIADSENLSAKLILAETRASAATMAEAFSVAQTLLADDATSRVLQIFDDLPSDIGSALSPSVLERSDLILCVERPLESKPDERIGDRFEYGSLLNLPRASSSVDAAVLVSRGLESDVVPFALREIFRVLKPGGQLVFTTTGDSTGLDLARSFQAAHIEFDEGEIPSLPVYSCFLRKNDVRGELAPPYSRSAAPVRAHDAPEGHCSAVDPQLLLLEEENTRQIMVVRDRFAERQKLVEEQAAIVDGAVQGAFGEDGWIWISNTFAEGYTARFFTSGWHPALHYVIWSRENKCHLVLPLPAEQSARDHDVELQLHLTLPGTSESNPMTVGVRADAGLIENFRLTTDDEILRVRFSTNSSKFRGVSLVEFRLSAEAEGGTERDANMAMGVRRFRYRLLGN